MFAFLRYDDEDTPVLAVSNFSPVVRHDYRLGVPDDIPAWHELLNTDLASTAAATSTTPTRFLPNPVADTVCASPFLPRHRLVATRRSIHRRRGAAALGTVNPPFTEEVSDRFS